MPVGEVLLGAFLQVLFDRMTSRELLNFARREGLGKKLDKWRKELPRIQAVLDDADEKQHTNEVVKRWVDDLRDLAYDVEDILDEFATEALLSKLRGENQVRNLVPVWCTGLTPHALKINIRLGSKITKITDRFSDLVKQESELRLKETADGRSYRNTGTLAPTSVMNEPRVYGRDEDKKALLKLLQSEKCRDAQVSVIPILGMGGIGKTTLAQLLFNEEEVEKTFDLKAWACVSQDFDVVGVTKKILKNVTPESCDDDDLNLLQCKLKEKLEGKKFLLVLDNLWNENYNEWNILCAPFQVGAPGSTIIITTRNESVSLMAGTVPAYNLQLLSNEFCLSLFTQHALEASNFSAHPNLQGIGKEIVIKMCKGLPLMAKILGSLLRTKRDRDDWENILKRKACDIQEVQKVIISNLMLSYEDLPSHIKRCFAYCSILPKGYKFDEEELILLWMAEGLIQEREGDMQMECLGREYFQDLLSRSLFQKSSNVSRFMMHNLISDLAKLVAKDTCFRMEDQIGGSNRGRPPTKARHSSYLRGKYDSTKKFEDFFELTCLRTFLPLMLRSPGSPEQSYLTYDIPSQLFSKLRCLRVFSLNGYYIQELPDSIGDLKHLRYLNLSYTGIRHLPKSTTTLCNLQTLILEGCSYLKELPSKLGNLVNLRHLNILNANKLEGMPPQIGKLTCLRTLSNLIVEKGNCFALKELGSLLHLQGTLIISRLEHAIEPGDARNAKLIEKPGLTELFLEWSANVDDLQDRTSELEVLNVLNPNKALKKLTIKCYGGTKFPTWLKGNSFHMVFLRIENCKKCTLLPPVGQLPSLKHLFIKGMFSVKNVGVEFSGGSCSHPLKSLETLCFKDMEEWESWSPNGEFPHLVELSIKNCHKLLGRLPNQLPLLKKLLVEECERLVVSIASFPELCELQIEGSTGVVCRSKVEFSLLKSKSLSKISEFTCPIEGFSFDVKKLAIENCEEQTSLWLNDVGLLEPLPCLESLMVIKCPKLISLVVDEGNEQPQLNLPSARNGMEYLPKAMVYKNTCLERINIWGCDSLTRIATGQLPPTLKSLNIRDCKNMLILLYADDTNSCSSNTPLLQFLIINNCLSLKSLTSSGELHATLEYLNIENCQELESIAKSFHDNSSLVKIVIRNCENLKSLPMGLDTLTHLSRFEIEECPALVSFPDEGLLPANLENLLIFDCEKLQALPNYIHNITSLQSLQIWKCPMVSFPEEGFPTNLTFLQIWDGNITESLLNWGLHKLTSLRHLEIRGGCPHLESFPEMMLPASLTCLFIRDIPNLKYLSSKCFRDLSSLKTLRIGWCEKLKSFPKEGLPLSLLHLSIICCYKFMSFPEDGLPPSLHRLDIANCPLLKERCKKVHGREWLKIAHIPCIQIDDRSIYDPEVENQPLDENRLHALFWFEWKPYL